MFKKIMMMSAFFVGGAEIQADIRDMAVGAVVAGAITGTVVYVNTRESNDAMMRRVDALWDFYSGNLNRKLQGVATPRDVKLLMECSEQFKKELFVFHTLVDQAYRDMSVRYASWMSNPFNWAGDMKDSYKKIRDLYQNMALIGMMFRYQPLICEWSETVSDAVVAKQVKLVCQGRSSYPLCLCANMLREDIEMIKNKHVCMASDFVMSDLLEKILVLVQGSADYIEERRIQDEIALKQQELALERRMAAIEEQKLQAKKGERARG